MNAPIRALIFTLLLLATSSLPSDAQARPKAVSCVITFFKHTYLNILVASHGDRTFQFEDLTGRPIKMTLGKRIGAGFVGGAYHLDQLDAPDITLSKDDDIVVKIAHSPAFYGGLAHRPRGDRRLLDEYNEQLALEAQLSEIWKDPVIQAKTDRWMEGRLPFASTIVKLDTMKGTLLFKNRADGRSFGALVKTYGAHIEGWPEGIRQSFKDIYELARVIHKYVKLGETENFVVDLLPDNLLWVSKPSQLKRFGLLKPSFVFIELTHLPKSARGATYHIERGNYQLYEQIIEQYISRLAKPGV